MDNKIRVKQFIAGNCYSYILNSKKEALIIDPHISLKDEYLKYLNKRKLSLKLIIDTHTHADHFSLAAVLKKELKIPVLMHEKAISTIATMRVKDTQDIRIGETSIEAMYCPGHTDDTINLYAPGMVFTADVLLIGSIGRTDFQNGSPESMYETLQKLKSLPRDTVIYPGHDYHGKKSSTINEELVSNPYLKEDSKNSFVNNVKSKTIPKPFNIDNIVRVNQKGEAASLEMISPKDAFILSNNNRDIKFLDVRSTLEFNETHIKDSLNIPIDNLSTRLNELSQDKRTYIVLCRTGNRSPMAADMLIQSGIHSTKILDGGLTRWQKDMLPIIKGAGGISLERQVRILAGSFVMSGIILSWLIHPWFIGISIFVSCGLIYAGITDNCMMGMLLMKLPYNKKLYKTKLGQGTCSIS